MTLLRHQVLEAVLFQLLISRLLDRHRPTAATSLANALTYHADAPNVLRRAIARAEAAAAHRPGYLLAMTLGKAWEMLASRHLSWDERGEALERALAHFEAAVSLAERLSASEAVALAATLPPEATCFPENRRALLQAQWRAGALLAAEFRVRDPVRAAGYLEAVIAGASGYHLAYYYLGEAYLLQRKFDDAERVWRRGLALSPDERAIALVLARLPQDRANHARNQKDWDGVVAALTTPEGRALRSVEMLRLLGDAYFHLGQLDEAEAAWRDALTISAKAGGIRGRLNKLARARRWTIGCGPLLKKARSLSSWERLVSS